MLHNVLLYKIHCYKAYNYYRNLLIKICKLMFYSNDMQTRCKLFIWAMRR